MAPVWTRSGRNTPTSLHLVKWNCGVHAVLAHSRQASRVDLSQKEIPPLSSTDVRAAKINRSKDRKRAKQAIYWCKAGDLGEMAASAKLGRIRLAPKVAPGPAVGSIFAFVRVKGVHREKSCVRILMQRGMLRKVSKGSSKERSESGKKPLAFWREALVQSSSSHSADLTAASLAAIGEAAPGSSVHFTSHAAYSHFLLTRLHDAIHPLRLACGRHGAIPSIEP
jgi:hypothetical protein